jgi:hypothetical protein
MFCKLWRNEVIVKTAGSIRKGKPVERRGRKAMGLHLLPGVRDDRQAAEESEA